MAGDWIKLRSDILDRPEFMCICASVGERASDVLTALYVLAGWFRTHGKHGVMRHPANGEKFDPIIIDYETGIRGLAEALIRERWLVVEDDGFVLKRFTSVSATRKCLNAKLRKRILASGKCAACGSMENLVIDHKVPISRGGSDSDENLQPLCRPCNISKGVKTMDEFMEERLDG
jgi:hypothetical protein